MAFKKRLVSKKKPTMKKRVYKRKSSPRMLTASAYPFPRTTMRKLKYVETFSINSGLASAIGAYTFACNGLYDPNITGVGHQPYGFDQLMALYNHYEVVSSRIKLTIADSTATNAMALICRVDADGNLLTSNLQLTLEQPDTKKIIFNPAEAHRTVLTHTWTQKKWFGSRKAGDDSLCGNSANNPTELSFFICGLASVDSGADAGNIFITAEIDYVARFFEPRELASS